MPYLQKYMPLLWKRNALYASRIVYREESRKVNLIREERAKLMGSIWGIVGVVVGLAVFIWFLSLLANRRCAFLVIFAARLRCLHVNAGRPIGQRGRIS